MMPYKAGVAQDLLWMCYYGLPRITLDVPRFTTKPPPSTPPPPPHPPA